MRSNAIATSQRRPRRDPLDDGGRPAADRPPSRRERGGAASNHHRVELRGDLAGHTAHHPIEEIITVLDQRVGLAS